MPHYLLRCGDSGLFCTDSHIKSAYERRPTRRPDVASDRRNPYDYVEIIIIFVPIFLPMLKHFNIDPVLWGTLVFVNLQAAFLSPPVAMSAFYLKGVAPKHVTLNQIFAGMMPYMIIVIVCMVIMYFWPGMTLWLPNYLYGGG